jgi:hypothetical protein
VLIAGIWKILQGPRIPTLMGITLGQVFFVPVLARRAGTENELVRCELVCACVGL